MNNYSTNVFRDILEGLPQIKYLRTESDEGITAMIFQGVHGNRVVIDITDDEMENEVVIGSLHELGLGYLCEALFPPNAQKN